MTSPDESLRRNLSQAFGLPAQCVDWLMDMWHTIQAFDDYADGAAVNRERLDGLIWRALVKMPSNPWFSAHSSHLLPVVATAIAKWQASDAAERAGEADEKSFVWRAGYYDLVMMSVILTHGEVSPDVARLVMQLYGESFNDYAKEFQGVTNA